MEGGIYREKKKILLARSLCDAAHVHIWDEPLNYFIDIFSRIQLEELILAYRSTILLVEHDKSFVERVGTKVVELSGACNPKKSMLP